MTGLPARQVAAELRRRLPGVGVKKLHKLLYYCQGHHLATFRSPLFGDSISAWDMGPVVGGLWKSEKDYGIAEGDAVLDEAALNTVGYVVSRYGGLTGSDLERLTHSEDPWFNADSRREQSGSVRIAVNDIEKFFQDNAIDDEDSNFQPDPATVRRWLSAATNPPQTVSQDSVDGIRARARSHG